MMPLRLLLAGILVNIANGCAAVVDRLLREPPDDDELPTFPGYIWAEAEGRRGLPCRVEFLPSYALQAVGSDGVEVRLIRATEDGPVCYWSGHLAITVDELREELNGEKLRQLARAFNIDEAEIRKAVADL